MTKKTRVQTIVVGAGIAGLWLQNELLARGIDSLLFDVKSAGGVQSLHSQGILHGGLKYSLRGELKAETTPLTEMPHLWEKSLRGEKGFLDLSDVKILSEFQYLFATESLSSKVTHFFARKTLHSAASFVPVSERPAPLQRFSSVYALSEKVVDTGSLMRSLLKKVQGSAFKMQVKIPAEFPVKSIFSEDGLFEFEADHYFFCAGKNNPPPLQLRPLRMCFVHGMDFPLFAHCMDFGTTRFTVTSYPEDGKFLWYIGGEVAEKGAHKSDEETKDFLLKELHEVFPELKISRGQVGTFQIDRAEERTATGLKPLGESLLERDNATIIWPTKLVLAPRMAKKAVGRVGDIPCKEQTRIDFLPELAVGSYEWET